MAQMQGACHLKYCDRSLRWRHNDPHAWQVCINPPNTVGLPGHDFTGGLRHINRRLASPLTAKNISDSLQNARFSLTTVILLYSVASFFSLSTMLSLHSLPEGY
jgi:hypothetical protein